MLRPALNWLRIATSISFRKSTGGRNGTRVSQRAHSAFRNARGDVRIRTAYALVFACQLCQNRPQLSPQSIQTLITSYQQQPLLPQQEFSAAGAVSPIPHLSGAKQAVCLAASTIVN